MTDVEFQDGGGSAIKLRDFNGHYGIPHTKREHWESMKSLETRDTDVFICSYPKSGLHWVWEIVTMLKKGDAAPIQNVMENHILDFVSASQRDHLPSPRVLTTHRYCNQMPDDVKTKRCKIVYLLRDPKDACVSYYHHLVKQKAVKYNGQFQHFVKLFLDGKVPFNAWTQHILNWSRVQSDVLMLVVHYEDMKQFPEREIRRLANYLEVQADDSLIRDIVTNTEFVSMKRAKESIGNPYLKYFKDGKEMMYRKGEVGDWRNWFSQRGQEEFDNKILEELGTSDLGILNSAKKYLRKHRL